MTFFKIIENRNRKDKLQYSITTKRKKKELQNNQRILGTD